MPTPTKPALQVEHLVALFTGTAYSLQLVMATAAVQLVMGLALGWNPSLHLLQRTVPAFMSHVMQLAKEQDTHF